ncbi:hypothetical protein DFH08DRAFT_628867, partial [Mycena albidolilacea]
CVTGLAIDHVAEQFQHSHTTISQCILDILSSAEFYAQYVHLPAADDLPPTEIQQNSKWWPYFRNVLGAIDGAHINCSPSAAERHTARNRK